MRTQLRTALTALIITATLPLHGQASQEPVQPTQKLYARFTATSSGPVLKNSVGFLTVSYQEGDHIATIHGTAFFVLYEDKRLGENQGFVYLVTNRHMADPQSNGRSALVVGNSIRVNLKTPINGLQSIEMPIPLGPNLHWCFPSDAAVDLAVIGWAPDIKIVDFSPFPVSMFAARSAFDGMNITEGSGVLLTGFFYQFPGQKKIEPIVRQGILAMLPDEDMTTTLGKPGHVYLADVHVFGGNSGSPVFVNVKYPPQGVMWLGSFPYRLLGVVSGYFYETQDFTLQVATTLSGKADANSGISVVVPADELKKILDSPELQAQRDAEVARRAK